MLMYVKYSDPRVPKVTIFVMTSEVELACVQISFRSFIEMTGVGMNIHHEYMPTSRS